VQLIQQQHVTAMIAVPAMVEDMASAAAAEGVKQLIGLKKVLVGAGGLSPKMQAAAAALLPNAALGTAYGMTEAASSITFIALQQQQLLMEQAAAAATAAAAAAAAEGQATRGAAAAAAAGVCVGQPAPGILVKVDPGALDKQQQQQQQQQKCSGSRLVGSSSSLGPEPAALGQQQCSVPGVVGEVLTRGPHTMSCYWGAPDATRQVSERPTARSNSTTKYQ
jgi:acyl-CoA synthetase (AMP-forming)/AMP-acid ligase II